MPRISQLPSLTTADNADEIAIVDVSASTTKKITRGDLLKAPLPTKSVTLPAINGGTTAGVLTTDASGTVSVGASTLLLGMAEVTAASVITTAGVTLATAASVVVPANKYIRISAYIPYCSVAGAAACNYFIKMDGTTIQEYKQKWQDVGDRNTINMTVIKNNIGGTKTFTLTATAEANNVQQNASATAPLQLVIEALSQ